MNDLIHLPVGIAPDPQGQQTGFVRRVKRLSGAQIGSRASARLTRLAGLLRPGRARSRRQEMTMSPAALPTERQLRYLRTLATRTATTFVPPHTRRAASQEIERLIALSQDQPDRSKEPGQSEAEEQYAPAVHPDEVTGFGSTATWRSQPPAARPTPDPGPVRLLTYRARGAERVLLAERRDGLVCVTDVPARGAGQRYEVEQLEPSEGVGPLRALVEDYKTRARELGEIPMAADALVRTLNGARDHG